MAKMDPKLSSAEALIQKQFPGAKVLVQTECKIGEEKLKAVGYLIQKKTIQSENHPLVPLIANFNKSLWTLSEIPTKLSYSKGGVTDFLSDFWNSEKSIFEGKYEIRCATPNEDKDIITAANGEFTESFVNRKTGKHICFQASGVYNSWACFNLNRNTKKIESSYTQMNAD